MKDSTKIQELEAKMSAIQKEIDELKNPFPVNKWYKNKHVPEFIVFKVKDFGYGVRGGDWSIRNPSNWTPATESEVFDMLKKEAIKRGFKEGVKFNSPKNEGMYWQMEQVILDCTFEYNKLSNRLVVKSTSKNKGGIIFSNGKWAEIIDSKLTICGHEVEKYPGHFKIGYKKIYVDELRKLKNIMEFNKFSTVQFDEYKVTLEEINKILEL